MSHGLSLSASKPVRALSFDAGSPADYDVRSFDSLAALRAAVSCRDDDGDDVFFTPAWFDNLAANGIEAHALPLWLLVRHRQSDASFCLPLLRVPRATGALWGPVLTSLSTYYSSLYGATGAAALVTPSACRAIARHLRRQRSTPGVIDLHPLDPDSNLYHWMSEALRREGWWVDSYFCFGNWHLDVAGRDFKTYAETIPSRLRNTIRRGRKKLEEAGNWTLEVHASPGPDLEQAIADFDAIYRQSWKVPEPFPSFVPGLCRTAARLGWLRLGVVRLGDVPIAAQLWLLRDGKALIYKLAYDEQYKRFSAGSVLSNEMMRRAIDEEQVLDVDYLTGDDAYKRDWMSHRRERRGLVAFDSRSLQGLTSAARHFGGRAWSRLRAARGTEGTASDPQAPGLAPAEP